MVMMIGISSKWSNDGIEVDETNSSYIRCTSEHLTSFAVLVAPGGEVSCLTDEFYPHEYFIYLSCLE